MPTDATQPVNLNLSDLQNFGQEYQSGANSFGAPYGLVYNPYTRGFEHDPNFLDPTQAQALATARLEYLSMTDPATAAQLATVHNASTNATQVPGTELGDYRTAAGSVPTVGTTYGQLQGTGASNVPQANNAAAQQLEAQLNTLHTAYNLAQQMNTTDSGNPVAGYMQNLFGKMGLDQNAKQYQSLISSLPPELQSMLQPATILGASKGSTVKLFTTALNNLHQQYAGLLGQGGAPAPSMASAAPVASPPVNFGQVGNFSAPSTADPYSGSAPANLNPAQMGANAYALGKMGVGNQ